MKTWPELHFPPKCPSPTQLASQAKQATTPNKQATNDLPRFLSAFIFLSSTGGSTDPGENGAFTSSFFSICCFLCHGVFGGGQVYTLLPYLLLLIDQS